MLAVQTADLGRAVGDGFEVLGREPGAEARGCSIAADEMLADARAVTPRARCARACAALREAGARCARSAARRCIAALADVLDALARAGFAVAARARSASCPGPPGFSPPIVREGLARGLAPWTAARCARS